ncbi:MAG: RsmE family RNA methyltransferase [Candidatus Omnitrophota bacterium]|nr:RsmE family RNA methyltransferase [Candidatus Omnitrophota bacterium]
MHRFFVNPNNIFKTEIIIDDKKEIHHALNVLRLKENDKLIAFDGKGNEILGSIQDISKSKIIIQPQTIIRNNAEKALDITLACAIPKRSKFDYVVEKTTELGVDSIIPLLTKRTEVHLSKERQALKIKHWQSIAINSAKQSQRITIPRINEVKNFREVLSSIDTYDLVLIPCLTGERKLLSDIFKQNSHPNKILVFIGPEGDFTKDEIDLAIKRKAKPVTLGELVLRVDTAAIYLVCAIKVLCT